MLKKLALLLIFTSLLGTSLLGNALGAEEIEEKRHGRGKQAITLWAIVFNEPENCTDPCGEDDLFENPGPPQTVVTYLAGLRVQNNGRMALGGSLAEDSSYGALPITPADRLFDADAAEVHLVVRTHDRYIPGLAHEQITTFDGGCDVQPCEDVQFVIFKPADADANGEQVTTVRRFSDESVVRGAWAKISRESDGLRVSVHTRLD